MNFETHSVAQTQALGAALARQLQPDDVLLMLGDMGAGKSEFTRGLARGLGVTGYVTSPTFTIMQLHDSGRLPLYHFDWYRLNDVEELYELSMDEYLHAGGVAVVEWPSRAEEAIPETYLEVALEPIGDDSRRITLTPVGGFRELDWKGLTL
ncbi:MAG: tRNA (adenosine(37)-N6)-threonylcarbamoyltransferase complex ATPase subunit type 1 TsaE [Clostridia bacterium]|nr:tRNA (adenosine(37)-N6)-threonylcarbamoyltransferase complex ATPase subunit type 1 TsaE [Clostridia bacterium]